MTTAINDQTYFKAKFIGLFKQANKKHNGNFVFSQIHWTYLKVDECEKIENFDALSQKTGDYWYSPIIRNKKGIRPFYKTTDIFIPRGTNEYYTGDIKNVLIRNMKINHEKTYFLHKDWQEASGDIYFQLVLPPPKKEKIAPPIQNVVSGTNIISNPIQTVQADIGTSMSPYPSIGATSIPANFIGGTGNGSINTVNTGITPTSTGTGKWATWLGVIFALIIYALIGYYLWTHFRTLSYIFLALILLNLIGQIFKNFGFARVLGVLASMAFIAYYLYANYKGLAPDNIDPLKTRQGKIKINPPNPKDDQNNDVSSEKEIQWYDFINNFYIANYQTSEGLFESSVEGQENIKNSITDASSAAEYYTRFYNGLYRMDDNKITQVAKIFSDSALKKNMDALQTAEMVITFIQEIPYYLVHDESCEKAVADGNEFLIEYHREGKPCLPNIAGGVQSPYEFLHNLKGDCDTRSLLAHAILRKLNIASSVWVSETYGHSILGVAVPAGHGMYKEINGIRHYGVELTAKGYRLGMVSPDQARPINWDITLYN
jgi:hypothetical protein